eukprot:3503825-Rhodomonas_salina.2
MSERKSDQGRKREGERARERERETAGLNGAACAGSHAEPLRTACAGSDTESLRRLAAIRRQSRL